MVIGFFEVRLSGILRFPMWLHSILERHVTDLKVVYFFDDLDCPLDEVVRRLPKNASVLKVEDLNHRGIIKLLDDARLDRLVVMAQRIPDSCFVSTAKSLGIPTIMYQHGLYVPFMKRQRSLFVQNLFKTFRFVKYAFVTASVINVNRFWLLMQYLRMFVLGHALDEVRFPSNLINADIVLIYGDYWREYHKQNFGYSTAQQYIVGAPDFSDVGELVTKETAYNSVCYIAQTLVEDGRLPRTAMLSFISNLSQAVTKSGLHLNVRLHPRSDLSLYEGLPKETVLSKTEFPKNVGYIGHYSSILAKAAFLSDNIILVDFPGHVIPDYIAMISNGRVSYNDQLGLASQLKRAAESGIDLKRVSINIEKQDRYFDSSIVNPLEAAALAIMRESS
jgi:hypothetical protein